MTDGIQGLRDDVAFMRALAEDGRNAPLMGGSILVTAGSVFAPASLAHWAVASGRLDFGPATLSVIWLAAVVVFLAVLFANKGRLARRAGGASGANRATGAVWTGVGFASFALWGAFLLASIRTGEWVIMDMFAVIILALYGAAWSVAAALTGRSWLKAVAGAAMLLAVGLAGLVGRPEQYLLYAAALVLITFLPGLVLLRQARPAAA
jgi:hypothetical protein